RTHGSCGTFPLRVEYVEIVRAGWRGSGRRRRPQEAATADRGTCTSPLVFSPIVHSTKEVILVQSEYLAQPDTGKRSPYRRLADAKRITVRTDECRHGIASGCGSPYGAAGISGGADLYFRPDACRGAFHWPAGPGLDPSQDGRAPWRRTCVWGAGRVWPATPRRRIFFRVLRDAANANVNQGVTTMSVVSPEMAHAPLTSLSEDESMF